MPQPFDTNHRETGQLALSFSFERRIYRVSELNASVQALFEHSFRGIWVEGEISNSRPATSGHYYFSLKDAQSQLKCVLFKGAARFVKFRPQDGLRVLARGNLDVYEARGEYQLIVELLEPQGAGALQLAFEQLKKKLAAEGLFAQDRKRPLPTLPRRLGIVTSTSGAAIRDILQILDRRFPGLHIRIFPALVQGEGSIDQIRAGLEFFSQNAWADVVILARGGGSLEDLWTFNEEAVARAIAASQVPVVSAVGHETDFTIADFVADLRAPTPSAAAELVICTRDSLLDQLTAHNGKLIQALRYRVAVGVRALHERGIDRAASLIHRSISRRVQRIDELDFALRRTVQLLIETRAKHLADTSRRLHANDLRLHLARGRHFGEALQQRFLRAMNDRLWQSRRRFESLDMRLRQLSPLAVLARGYAIVQNAQGEALRSSSETAPGEDLSIRLSRGKLSATVVQTQEG
jgi:exodeoxyribonuclease VII large subunit